MGLRKEPIATELFIAECPIASTCLPNLSKTLIPSISLGSQHDSINNTSIFISPGTSIKQTTRDVPLERYYSLTGCGIHYVFMIIFYRSIVQCLMGWRAEFSSISAIFANNVKYSLINKLGFHLSKIFFHITFFTPGKAANCL